MIFFSFKGSFAGVCRWIYKVYPGARVLGYRCTYSAVDVCRIPDNLRSRGESLQTGRPIYVPIEYVQCISLYSSISVSLSIY